MNLTSLSESLASARLTSSRECIVAGVTPGLQNLRQHTGLRDVAGRELAAKPAAARDPGRQDSGGRPDQSGAVRDRLRSNARSSGRTAAATTARRDQAREIIETASKRMRRTRLPVGLPESLLLVGYQRPECEAVRS